MKTLIFTISLFFTFAVSANQARIVHFPSADGVDSCGIFMDNNLMIPGPNYEQLFSLLEFKPETKNLVKGYLNIPSYSYASVQVRLGALKSEQKYKGTPEVGTYSSNCQIVQPLAAELNLMFGTGFRSSRLPVLIDIPKTTDLLGVTGNDDNPDGPAVFPNECWDRVDLQDCKEEVESGFGTLVTE